MAFGKNIRTYFEGRWHEGDIPVMRAADHGIWQGSSVFDGARLFDGLVPDLEAHCARVAQHYRLERRPGSGTFTVPELQTNRMGDRRRRRERYVIDQPFTRKSFYQDGGYLADYAPEDLAHVIDELDADLLETLGYALPDRPQVQRHPCQSCQSAMAG